MIRKNGSGSRARLMRQFLGGCAVFALVGCASVDRLGLSGSAPAHSNQSDQAASNLRLARASRASHDFASAVNLYRTAVAADPRDATIQVELGDTLVDAGSYDDANNAYNQVDPASPARPEALLGLMRVALVLNETGKALAYADAALQIAPHDVKVLIGRGVALDTVGRHADAQQSYRTVIAADPHNIAARNDLSLSLALMGKFDEAIQIMEPIALSSNATTRSRQNLALIYGLKGDDAHALAMSNLDLEPKTAAANLRFFDLIRTSKN